LTKAAAHSLAVLNFFSRLGKNPTSSSTLFSFYAFGITKLGLPPFIMTLATLTALRGVGLVITNGATISTTKDAFTGLSRGDFLGVPNLFWMVAVVAIPGYIFLHQRRFGRYLFAIGSNAEAARLSGVNTVRMIYIAYIV
jgi:ribose transport system permease protein